MTMTINLPPDIENEAREAAARQGVDTETFVAAAISHAIRDGMRAAAEATGAGSNPTAPDAPAKPAPSGNAQLEELQARLRRWQDEDRTPLMPSNSTRELFDRWRKEDARMTDEEREAEDRFWHEFLQSLNDTRKALGMRVL